MLCTGLNVFLITCDRSTKLRCSKEPHNHFSIRHLYWERGYDLSTGRIFRKRRSSSSLLRPLLLQKEIGPSRNLRAEEQCFFWLTFRGMIISSSVPPFTARFKLQNNRSRFHGSISRSPAVEYIITGTAGITEPRFREIICFSISIRADLNSGARRDAACSNTSYDWSRFTRLNARRSSVFPIVGTLVHCQYLPASTFHWCPAQAFCRLLDASSLPIARPSSSNFHRQPLQTHFQLALPTSFYDGHGHCRGGIETTDMTSKTQKKHSTCHGRCVKRHPDIDSCCLSRIGQSTEQNIWDGQFTVKRILNVLYDLKKRSQCFCKVSVLLIWGLDNRCRRWLDSTKVLSALLLRRGKSQNGSVAARRGFPVVPPGGGGIEQVQDISNNISNFIQWQTSQEEGQRLRSEDTNVRRAVQQPRGVQVMRGEIFKDTTREVSRGRKILKTHETSARNLEHTTATLWCTCSRATPKNKNLAQPSSQEFEKKSIHHEDPEARELTNLNKNIPWQAQADDKQAQSLSQALLLCQSDPVKDLRRFPDAKDPADFGITAAILQHILKIPLQLAAANISRQMKNKLIVLRTPAAPMLFRPPFVSQFPLPGPRETRDKRRSLAWKIFRPESPNDEADLCLLAPHDRSLQNELSTRHPQLLSRSSFRGRRQCFGPRYRQKRRSVAAWLCVCSVRPACGGPACLFCLRSVGTSLSSRRWNKKRCINLTYYYLFVFLRQMHTWYVCHGYRLFVIFYAVQSVSIANVIARRNCRWRERVELSWSLVHFVRFAMWLFLVCCVRKNEGYHTCDI
eukprot:284817367_6